MIMNNNYENLVVVAAGGGNDVFSAIAYINAQHSNKTYKNIVLFGILGLTPFHTNDKIKSKCVNTEEPIIIPTTNMKRYIMMKIPKEIYANESMLPLIINNICPQITYYACLSPKYSALEQAQNIRSIFLRLGLSELNTVIEIVDFGGDILTDGEQSSIISPELDAFSLAIIRNLSEYKSHIVVCFPGVDGELDKSYLEFMCETKATHNELIDPELWNIQLKNLYNSISSTRPGNTIPNMLNVLNNNKSCKVTKTFTIGKDKYTFTRDVDISMSLQNRIYYFDININNPFVDVFNSNNYDFALVLNNVLDIYAKQTINDQSNQLSDIYLQYLIKDLNGLYTNRHLIYDNDNCVNQPKVVYDRTMFVDVIPRHFDKNQLLNSINELQTYDILFTN